jgi:hypothetical protein
MISRVCTPGVLEAMRAGDPADQHMVDYLAQLGAIGGMIEAGMVGGGGIRGVGLAVGQNVGFECDVALHEVCVDAFGFVSGNRVFGDYNLCAKEFWSVERPVDRVGWLWFWFHLVLPLACLVDLGSAKFELVVEGGWSPVRAAFEISRGIPFPSSRWLDRIWRREDAGSTFDVSSMPAYSALRELGLDTCGLAQLASRTVGVPFVGLIAPALAASNPLRRLHGACWVEIASGSALDLNDIERVRLPFSAYAFGHLPAQNVRAGPMSSQ